MPERLRVVLVDDEAPARALLREYLAAHDDVEVAGECANGFEAVKAIHELRPDVVFLDVQMPKLDGFEVLELLEPGPAVVFCTAYDEYALRAFEVHAVDYLLKPFGRERLGEALTRVRERRAAVTAGATRSHAGAAPAAAPVPVPAAPPATQAPAAGADDDAPDPARPASATARAQELGAAARPGSRPLERILVRDGAKVHVIPVEQVDYLEAQDDYVAIHAQGRSWLKPQPLAELAAQLDPLRFVRIHRSYVLQVTRLARLELYAKDSRVAILPDGRQLPVSRSGYARLKDLM